MTKIEQWIMLDEHGWDTRMQQTANAPDSVQRYVRIEDYERIVKDLTERIGELEYELANTKEDNQGSDL